MKKKDVLYIVQSLNGQAEKPSVAITTLKDGDISVTIRCPARTIVKAKEDALAAFEDIVKRIKEIRAKAKREIG